VRWLNAAAGARSVPREQPLLVEFWDFCRVNSMRTLPYVKSWHERYAPAGLRVIGVHCPGFEPGRSPHAVQRAVARLGIEYPVVIDGDFEVWREYGNEGWPARYLFDRSARLFDYHYGEGGYRESELAIQELLGCERDPLPPLRPEDAPDARLAPQSEDQPGAYSGPYEAGGVWTVLDGSGELHVELDDRGPIALPIEQPGAYPLVEHPRHTRGQVHIEPGEGVSCLATCFTPGVL
jgi:hypothetical protein